MNFGRLFAAYLPAALVTYVVAAGFYTQQIIAKQVAVGATYSLAQDINALLLNIVGLWQYGATLAIGLLLGFVVGARVKRWLTPLAPVAYPIAGATAVLAVLMLIETMYSGGVGAIGGARDGLGIFLQCLAGFIGGGVFERLRPR